MPTTTENGSARYWDYGSTGSSTGTTGNNSYYSTGGTGTTWTVPVTYRRFLVTDHPFVTKKLRARYTQIVNDETTSLGHITMWMSGDVDVVDFGVEIRKWEDFLPLLRQVANSSDWETLNDFLEAIPVHDEQDSD